MARKPALKFISFVLQWALLGLAAAVLIDRFWFKDELLTPQTGPASYRPAVEHAAPAVVNIYTSWRAGFTELQRDQLRDIYRDQLPPEHTQNSLGSGVIVSADGYILTNNHVINNAEAIKIALEDGRVMAATIVGIDPETDIAVLKINGEQLPHVVVNPDNQAVIGDVVLAIGNPYGVGQTVTQGIISATGRSELGLSTFENFLQTDAAISPGNSGGALVNSQGALLGINTAIFSRTGGYQGISFAIPSSLAHKVMTEIIQHGEVTRGWLGVDPENMTFTLAKKLGLPNIKGVMVEGVFLDSPADMAGLQPYDVITWLNDTRIDNRRQALHLVATTKPGSKLKIKFIRKGKEIEASAVMARRPRLQGR